jgi:hypothetical protein
MDLLNALNSQRKTAYSKADLYKLGVCLASFDPEDPSFLDSRACLFQPLGVSELQQYSLNNARLSRSDRDALEFRETYQCPPGITDPSPSDVAIERAGEIVQYLNTLYNKSEKKHDPCRLGQVSGWDGIR